MHFVFPRERYGGAGEKALREAADVLGGAAIAEESLKKPPKSSSAESGFVQ